MNKNVLSKLSDSALLEFYNASLNTNLTMQELAELYETTITKKNEWTRTKLSIREQIRNDLIDEVLEKVNSIKPPQINENKPFEPFEVHLKPLPPKLKPEEIKPIRYDQSPQYIKSKDNQLFEKVNQQLKQIQQPKEHIDFYNQIRSSFKQTYDDYKKLKETQNKEINSLAVELGKKLDALDNHWEIDFEKFDKNGRKDLFPILETWLHNKIDVLPLTDHYKFSFKVGDNWHTRPFSQELYNKLIETFTEQNFIYEMKEYNPSNDFISGGTVESLPDWSLFSAIKIDKNESALGVRDDIGGHFFRYLIKSSIPENVKNYLNRLQIFETISVDGLHAREELNDCCFIYSLKQTGKFTEDELDLMRLRIKSRYISQGNISKLCEEFKIKLIVSRIDEGATKNKRTKVINHGNKYLGYANADKDKTFTFALYEEHYFIEEKTQFTSNYIEHIDDAPIDAFNKRLRKVRGVYKWVNETETKRFISSSDLIRSLMKQNKFIPIDYATGSILSTTLYDNVKDRDFKLDIISPSSVFRVIAPYEEKEKDKEVEITYWYSDFEADTRITSNGKPTGKPHVPYLNITHSADGTIDKVFKGPNCAKEFLNFLPENAVVYFHNLAYDWCMFNRLLTRTGKVIRKGTKVYQARAWYHKKYLTFKDSYPIFMCKLSRLPASFGLEGIKKELFPYNYYSLERLESNIGIINEAGKYELKQWNRDECEEENKKWTSKDYETFIENIDSIPGCRLSETTFDMYKYSIFYCEQDVRILRLSFEKLADGFMKEFNVNVKTLLTTPTLANEFFKQNVYLPNGNLYEVGGHVREFLAKAVYGGRCMCAYNKKWHINKPIYDYDAVSLYPSAMNRLWTVEGKPEVLNVPNQEQIYSSIPDYLIQYNTLNGIGAYVIQIEILKANKHYAFPLIVQKTKEGNLNDDKINEPIKMFVDNILLEDLIEFQKIEFKVIKGYVWNGKRDYKIQETIKTIFNKRLEYKKQKNPLQELYKLIMNSSYGKTIQKPIDSDLKFLSKHLRTYKSEKLKGQPRVSELEAYWIKNYNKIIEEISINDDVSVVKVRKQIDDHFNFSLLGIQVLNMSKRIMNEVMCLGFDLGCHIYYQDTDSMHIEADDLPTLEEAFEQKYNRQLRGSNLGQFHSDFPTINGHDEIPKSIESYFIMKKCYIDKLQDSTGEIDYMIRGKGLTQNSIEHAAEKKGGLMNLYESLYEGNLEEFDLTYGQPMFEMNKNFTVSTKEEFIRRTKSYYENGDPNDYFKY